MTLDSVYTGPLKAEKDSEFICSRCHARCTESPTDGTEYGHKAGCPRREIDRSVNGGPAYDPENDPRAQPDETAIADGGDRHDREWIRDSMAPGDRGATGAFAFFYPSFVAIVGLTEGLLIRESQSIPAEQPAGVWTITGHNAVAQRIFEFIDEADEEVIYVTVDALLTVDDLLTDDHLAHLRDADERGMA